MLNETIGTWIGIALGVAGLVAGYVFYRRSLTNAILAYAKSSLPMTGRNALFPPELKIFYGDKEVESVTQAHIVIWNAGNSTIDGERIVSSDPLRIILSKGELFSEGEILAASITMRTRDVNAFTGKQDGANQFLLLFDFLDPGDGAVVSLTYAGRKEASIRGTIRGIPTGIKFFGHPAYPPTKGEIAQVSMISLAGLIGISLSGYLRHEPIFWVGLLGSVFILLVGILGAIQHWKRFKRVPPLELLEINREMYRKVLEK